MTHYLSDLDGQLDRHAYLIDPRFGGSSAALSRIAEKRSELNRALADRRRQRRAARSRARQARQPIARTA